MNNIEKIKEEFQFLSQKEGFDEVGSQYSESDFGNCYVTYSNGTLEVRVLCDRGQFFVEFREIENFTDWFDLSLIRMMRGVEGMGSTASSQACILKGSLEFLRNMFSSPQSVEISVAALRALEQKRRRERFGQ